MISKYSVRTGIAFVVASVGALAAPVKTQVSSKTELAYASDVSSTDLLHGLTATTTGTWTGNGAGAAKLNDGIHGNTASVDSAGSVAWASPGATATFTLGNGNGFGWNITSIQSIAAWVSVGFGNQAFTVSVRYAGESTFTPLPDLSVDYQPLTTNPNPDPGATKVILTDNAGPLVSGIDAIRFTAQSVNGGLNSGRFTFREIDVQGVQATAPADSDGDGTNDQAEIAAGTNPSDAGSFPMPPLRIMPVGDSITAGYTDNPTWNEPFNFGYRSGLYTRLK
ncbi:MAG TPA: thrombospondin type 3 repeat-containing protein, partial [Luteolibacter sp.]|nr:thrombospondin type 3 repeat-containing protein [Luteolibacter sp.]